jgi:signal transduction histidine kinase
VERIIEQSSERRELIRELEATRAELAEVSREAGVMAERERLAAEIHDTLAQGFTSILMLLQAAEPRIGPDPAQARRQVGLAVRTARENLAEARALVAAVPPTALGDSSLDEAVRRLSDRLGEELDVATECVVSGEPRRLAARSEVVLLRAAQEGLANVRKHAKASRVGIELAYGATAVRLHVRDDGTGFDPDRANGFGLRGMRERAAQVDGTLDVRSAPGAGTTLTVEVPA